VSLGAFLYGNNATQNFASQIINADTDFEVRATKTITGCGSLTKSKIVSTHISPVFDNMPVSSNINVACKNSVANITIKGTQPGVSYQLQSGATPGNSIVGVGNDIVFTSLPIPSTTIFSINAKNNKGCTATLKNTVAVTIELPVARFTLNSYALEAGQPLAILNTSVNAGGHYNWLLEGVSPSASSDFQPAGISYATPGSYKIQLSAISPLASCTSTVQKKVQVSNIPVNSCASAQLISTDINSNLQAMNVDGQDNMYVVNYLGTFENAKVFNKYSDTLAIVEKYTSQFQTGMTISKFNYKGITTWMSYIRFGSSGWAPSAITADKEGGVYLLYFHEKQNDTVAVTSTDGSVYKFNTGYAPSSYGITILIKFNKYGILEWVNNSLNDYYASTTTKHNIKVGPDGYIYIAGGKNFAKFDKTGKLYWNNFDKYSFYGGVVDFDFDTQGNIYALQKEYLYINKHNVDGAVIWSSPYINKISGNIAASGLRMDKKNNLYITGNFNGQFVFKNDTITDIYNGGNTHDGGFVLKMDSVGSHLWLRQFQASTGLTVKGFALKNDVVHFMSSAYSPVNLFKYGSVAMSSLGGYVYAKLDPTGLVLSFEKLSEGVNGKYLDETTPQKDLIAANQVNDDVSKALYFVPLVHPEDGDQLVPLANYDNYIFLRGKGGCKGTFVGQPTELQEKDALIVYPNPSNGSFTIEMKKDLEQVKIKIYDRLGGLVYSSDQVNKGKASIQITSAEIADGIYMVQVSHSTGTAFQKILIIR
jgi:hypothetical protein